MPERIQLSRKKGWRMPANTLKVDRSTKWGNPFKVVELPTYSGDCSRGRYVVQTEVRINDWWTRPGGETFIRHRKNPTDCVSATSASIEMFREYATFKTKTDPEWLSSLCGKNLACWCKPGSPCHADVLLELANKPEVK